ncbi:Pyridoxal-dependent decarboxylase conserved domain [Metamycoplasma arthritidis]|uniref:Pyridoxal-dependent decarboxylase n=1 Tax=Metamycoplasma arthritidis (strain 158L3-1) TaxID=243272 RepID=B3PMH0_META1|nr:pyridoxal-dependent decarboxylase [Metamycoplasma arthritidis]ACF07222.1 pyridoxal-dependent decarboxylase [Metamycoplasma arthritidis 158L3-1]VEU78746.1 Pyridoxal-dependent decarboxylase conserved domain [Metamycoplasma arthritidis]
MKKEFLIKKYVSKLLKYFTNNFDSQPKISELDPNEIFKKLWKWKIEDYKFFEENLARLFGNQKNERYLSFPDTGIDAYGFIGDFINILLNPITITYFNGSPLGTIVEIDTINKIRRLLNLDDTKFDIKAGLYNLGGVWTLGGTMANHLAINDHISKYLLEHNDFDKKIALLKNDTHYSVFNGIKNALQNNDKVIFIDKNYIEFFFEKNHEKIAFVIATFGTSGGTSKHNALKIMDMCNKYNLPLHIDAAQGFVDFIVNPIDWNKFKNEITISIDFHKALHLNYGSSYLIAKNADFFNFKLSSSSLDLAHLNNLVGSKSCNSLKTWLFLQNNTQEEIVNKILGARESLDKLLAKILTNKNVKLLTNDYMHKALVSINFNSEDDDFLMNLFVNNMIDNHGIIFDVISYPIGNKFSLVLGISTSQKISTKKINEISQKFLYELKKISQSQEMKPAVYNHVLSPATWQNANFSQLILKKVEKFSKLGFYIEGSTSLWLTYKDYYKLPNDIDLVLLNNSFNSFDEKFNYLKSAINKPNLQQYDIINWVEDWISIDILLTANFADDMLMKKTILFQGKNYQVNLVKPEYTYFSKIVSYLYKAMNTNKIEKTILKKDIINDIVFLSKKVSLTDDVLEKWVLHEIKSAFYIYWENIYYDLEKTNIDLEILDQKSKTIIAKVIALLIKNKNFAPKIDEAFRFDWKKLEN